MKIFLCGYMGSGKSLVAKHLGLKLQYPHIDLDDQIALIESQTIPEIFEKKGELYFRRLESKVLQDTLEEPKSLVIALGGGTPTYGDNLQLIKDNENTRLIYLKASVDFLSNRLFSEKEGRPVITHLKHKDDLEDFIRKHLFERSYFYNQADIIVNVEGKNPQEITQEIGKLL